ncbi:MULTISPECIES: phytanoyl-CoA dioxygenase family protein [unclassified Coleofasciculus]|uniref:phytanoyl-CoA dioxygenase family protein n=1 Tax=unclassified Coleofasciculus TaxID=2692782 RepID=UPI0018824155|nr:MULTISPECIES: phytanoyl-CoA dioxygenase family protein [unclassified Coleofasciculus]MBE9128378.1 phytanoyl-CoA dioxygenase family protein [Coleofasciculus sp. LEGE 07081]MBE9151434.1 phytanoyl-CoA dioxygenase family protein [Coleofasciculus sp. LEGE 07092]
MNSKNLKLTWEQYGYIIFPDFIDETERTSLKQICDRILNQIIADDKRYENTTNIAFLTEPNYFIHHHQDLLKLLEFIAAPRILSILTQISGQSPLFHNTQYFYKPKQKSWDGIWHRDTQFNAPYSELEQQRMSQMTGVHFRVAFEDDTRLEYVPGSHQRWDTEAELTIRKGNNPTQSEMPGRERIELKAGDACLFHAWGIHRGTYRAEIPRSTFDIIYGWGGLCDWGIPKPTCFADLSLLEELSNTAKIFYQNFIETYQSYWMTS